MNMLYPMASIIFPIMYIMGPANAKITPQAPHIFIMRQFKQFLWEVVVGKSGKGG